MEEKLDAILRELKDLREQLELANGKQIMTLEETANFLGIGMNAMYELKKQPGFPVKLCGPRVYRVPKQALVQWMNENNYKQAM